MIGIETSYLALKIHSNIKTTNKGTRIDIQKKALVRLNHWQEISIIIGFRRYKNTAIYWNEMRTFSNYIVTIDIEWTQSNSWNVFIYTISLNIDKKDVDESPLLKLNARDTTWPCVWGTKDVKFNVMPLKHQPPITRLKDHPPYIFFFFSLLTSFYPIL